jgi:hypothetical protein
MSPCNRHLVRMHTIARLELVLHVVNGMQFRDFVSRG